MKKTREDIIQEIMEHKIIAILRKVPSDALGETVDALYRGGIRMMEVTFDQAEPGSAKETLGQIRHIVRVYPDVALGAGTVMTIDQVRQAHEAGAQYMISPNTSEAVIKETVDLGMVSIPGAFSATEAANAHLFGADFVKIFPVGKLGPGYVKDMAAPLAHIRFLAVGRINDKNMKEYLDAGCCGIGVSSALVDKKLIAEGDFEQLEKMAKRYVDILKE